MTLRGSPPGAYARDVMSPLPRPLDLETVTDVSALLCPGRAWLGRSRFAVWTAERSLVGWVLWSHMADEDAADMKRLWIDLAGRVAPPYDFVLDLRSLDSLSSGAFSLVREFATTGKPGLRRMAILVGEDTTGGVIQLGLFVLRPPRFAWSSFHTYGEVAAWFERPDAAAVLAAVDRRTADRAVETTPLARLRALLSRSQDAGMDEVARDLGLSTRSLQRALADWGTTFSEERDRARVLQAQELLRDPETKLDAVAAAVGCGDRRSLNRLFRRVTGESPAEFRRRRGLGGERPG
jgi:AraC-like DNA-binding protein